MMNNLNVEIGMLCDEIRSLRKEVASMRNLIAEQQNGANESNFIKGYSEGNVVSALSINKSNDLDCKISELLINYQISAHLKGFRYLKEAIKMEITDFWLSAGITKVVYPAIAKKYNDAPNRVERAMRHAIENAWYKSNHPDIVQRMINKPSNSEFIAIVAEKIRLESEELSA